MVVFGQCGCIPPKVVVFLQKLLYSGKNRLSSEKKNCIWAKWLHLGKKGCIRAQWLYSDKNGCIRAKVVVFGQSGCIRASVVLIGQKWL